MTQHVDSGRSKFISPIEKRAVSATFLREFSATQITPQLCEVATAEAIQYLSQKIKEVAVQLVDLQRQRAAPDSEQAELTRASSAAQRVFSQQKLSAKLELLNLDMRRRKKRPYMTTRDVHKLIIKVQTDIPMCRYTELPWVRGLSSVVQAGTMPAVGPADSFISHSWDSPWDALVDALCEHSDRSVSKCVLWPSST
jgi:hypothetical protein